MASKRDYWLRMAEHRALQSCYRDLVCMMRPMEMCDHLISKGILDLQTQQQIHLPIQTDTDRNRLLLDSIMRSQSRKAFQVLIESLQENQKHLADNLQAKAAEIRHQQFTQNQSSQSEPQLELFKPSLEESFDQKFQLEESGCVKSGLPREPVEHVDSSSLPSSTDYTGAVLGVTCLPVDLPRRKDGTIGYQSRDQKKGDTDATAARTTRNYCNSSHPNTVPLVRQLDRNWTQANNNQVTRRTDIHPPRRSSSMCPERVSLARARRNESFGFKFVNGKCDERFPGDTDYYISGIFENTPADALKKCGQLKEKDTIYKVCGQMASDLSKDAIGTLIESQQVLTMDIVRYTPSSLPNATPPIVAPPGEHHIYPQANISRQPITRGARPASVKSTFVITL